MKWDAQLFGVAFEYWQCLKWILSVNRVLKHTFPQIRECSIVTHWHYPELNSRTYIELFTKEKYLPILYSQKKTNVLYQKFPKVQLFDLFAQYSQQLCYAHESMMNKLKFFVPEHILWILYCSEININTDLFNTTYD